MNPIRLATQAKEEKYEPSENFLITEPGKGRPEDTTNRISLS
jgi:hypothetical protein